MHICIYFNQKRNTNNIIINNIIETTRAAPSPNYTACTKQRRYCPRCRKYWCQFLTLFYACRWKILSYSKVNLILTLGESTAVFLIGIIQYFFILSLLLLSLLYVDNYNYIFIFIIAHTHAYIYIYIYIYILYAYIYIYIYIHCFIDFHIYGLMWDLSL